MSGSSDDETVSLLRNGPPANVSPRQTFLSWLNDWNNADLYLNSVAYDAGLDENDTASTSNELAAIQEPTILTPMRCQCLLLQ